MSKVRLTGTTSGFTELTAPAVAGSNTLTLPTGNGSADQRLVTNGSGALSFTSDVMLAAGSAGSPSLYFSGDTNTGMWSPAADTLAWSTGGTERMRIFSDGAVSIGHSADIAIAGTIAPLGYVGRSGYSGSFANVFNIAWTGVHANLWIDDSNFGAIQTVSDYRIKKNIQTQTASATERIKQLRPVTYELKDYGSLFKADGIVREGFIAHEVQEVIPSGAEGEKDEENRIQNLRLDAIVSVLTKALQEAIAKIEALEARITALEVN